MIDRDNNYKSSYFKTLETLEYKSSRPDFDRAAVQNELRSLYAYEDLGWAGRGMVKDAEISGAIAAYEAFLSALKENEQLYSR